MEFWSPHDGDTLVEGEEVLLLHQYHVALYDGEAKRPRWDDGRLSLTTRRLLYEPAESPSGPRRWQLAMETLLRSGVSPSSRRGAFFSHDKIILPLPANQHVRLSFRGGGMTDFFTALTRALAQPTRWSPPAPSTGTAAPAASPAAPRGEASTAARGIGIAGVQQASTESARLGHRFTDIEDVMQQASVLVAEIRRLRGRAAADAATGADDTAIESIEATLGLGTLVRPEGGVRSGAPGSFAAELAPELHAWMGHPRNAHIFGAMPLVPLIELFSLYNKARGGDLVSPEDLLGACRHMVKQPTAQYTLETLSSGRVALVHRDRSILLSSLVPFLGHRIVRGAPPPARGTATAPRREVPTTSTRPSSARDLRGVTEVQLAGAIKVAAPVARDILQNLEQEGYLCRSEMGFGCCMFHWNIFVVDKA